MKDSTKFWLATAAVVAMISAVERPATAVAPAATTAPVPGYPISDATWKSMVAMAISQGAVGNHECRTATKFCADIMFVQQTTVASAYMLQESTYFDKKFVRSFCTYNINNDIREYLNMENGSKWSEVLDTVTQQWATK